MSNDSTKSFSERFAAACQDALLVLVKYSLLLGLVMLFLADYNRVRRAAGNGDQAAAYLDKAIRMGYLPMPNDKGLAAAGAGVVLPTPTPKPEPTPTATPAPTLTPTKRK